MQNALREIYDDTRKSMTVRSRYAWLQHTKKNTALDVFADLTFKQAIPTTYSDTIRHYLTEDIASQNISVFYDRLNYKVYKQAYKRYKKKLDIIVAVEGGFGLLRENRNKTDYDKRFHTHILLQQPSHICFDDYKIIILDAWLSTKWGYFISEIEPLKSTSPRIMYQTKNTLDCVDLNNTYFNR